MEAPDIQSLFFDFHFAVPAAWCCLVAALVLAFRRPAANAFLNLSLVGIGGAPVFGNFTYARVSGLVAILSTLVLLFRKRDPKNTRGMHLSRGPTLWLAALCLLILAKILCETAIYGLDSSRAAFLQAGLIEMVFPAAITAIGVARSGPEPVARDLLVGMLVFPAMAVLGYLPFAFREGLLSAAVAGVWRFAIGSADAISSARVLTYGGLAAFMIPLARKRTGRITTFTLRTLAVVFIVLLVLTGTRQYLLAVLAFLVLWAFYMQRWTGLGLLAGFGTGLAGAAAVYFIVVANSPAIVGRVSVAAMQEQLADERGAIWKEAWADLLRHPLLGVGFKNFGVEAASGVDRNGDVVMVRDTAHGVFQDVFTEHGLFLGSAFLGGSILLAFRWWRLIRRERRTSAQKALAIVLLSLLVPLLFSSAFLNATALYLLLALALFQPGRAMSARSEKAQHGERSLTQPAGLKTSEPATG